MSEQAKDAPTPGSRKNRRVQWQPEGVQVDPSYVDTPEENSGEDWAERSLSNDEQLKRDKPPHWG